MIENSNFMAGNTVTKHPLKVVLVEDEKFARNVLYAILNEIVDQVWFAEDGRKGLSLIRTHRPDIVITDISMPGLSGLQMLREAKTVIPNLKTIVTTSYSETDYFLEAIELSVNRFILKPYNKNTIKEVFDELSQIIFFEKKFLEQEAVRINAEQALKEREVLFRSLFDYAPLAIFLLDPTTFRIIDANKAATKLFGYSREEFLELSQIDLTYPEEASRIMQTYGIPSLEFGDERRFEIKVKHKSGNSIYTEAREKIIKIDGKVLVIGMFSDLTERKLYEEQLFDYQSNLENKIEQRTAELLQTNAQLKREIERRNQIEKELVRRSHYENLVSSLATDFISASADSIEYVVNHGLEQMCQITGAERAFFVKIIDLAPSPDFFSYPVDLSGSKDFYFFEQQIDSDLYKSFRTIRFDVNREDEIPASVLKCLKKRSIRCASIVPVYNGVKLGAIIGLESQKSSFVIDSNLDFLMNVVGQIILNSLLRNQAIGELAESEEKAHALLNATTDSMLLLDNSGNILEANEKAADFFGLSANRLVQKSYFNLFPDQIAFKRKEAINQVLETGRRVVFRDSLDHKTFEHSVYPLSGSLDFPSRVAFQTKEITSFINAQNRLQTQFNLLQTLIDSIPNPIYYKNEFGRFTGFNKAFLSAYGKGKEEIMGKTIFDIESPSTAAIFHEQDELLLSSLQSNTFELTLKLADKKEHAIIVSTNIFYDYDGHLEGLIGVFTDVTNLRELQSELKSINHNLEKQVENEVAKFQDQQKLLIQKSKLESLGQLSAGIAHEINQPLGSISMALENVMLKLSKEAFSREYIETKISHAFENIERIKHIIDHVRTFSRDQRFGNTEIIEISMVIQSALDLVARQYKHQNIEILLNKKDEHLFFKGNRYKFEQVILNLLANAKDAITEKELRNPSTQPYKKMILINCYRLKDWVVATIRDNGTGMDNDTIDSAFEPFFTTKDVNKGTGLGLSIVYGIIKEMSGNISITSEPGVFTEVNIEFPRVNGNSE